MAVTPNQCLGCCFFVIWSVFSGSSLASEAPITIKGAITVDTQTARAMYDNEVVFVDVRTREKWRWGHIVGSHHFGLRTTFGLLRHQVFLQKEKSLVIYGDGAHTMRAALASYMAVAWGYEKVFFYREGYFSWLASDLPVSLLKRNKSSEDDLNAVIFQNYTDEP